ncbi:MULTISPECIES: hypothetical protein [Duganella]|uniref:hypothetical protein n=1 Tax=Duganella TaxID=75654 RepID=UPI00159E6F97
MKILSTLAAATILLAPPQASGAADASPPQFSSHQVSDIYSGPTAKPRLLTKKDREFGSRLREAAAQHVNFAGHFVVATWGCGASCVMGAILDARSGKVTWLPFIICCGDYDSAMPVDFRPDSALIVFKGMRNEQGPGGTYYYVYERDKLKLLAEQPQPAN